MISVHSQLPSGTLEDTSVLREGKCISVRINLELAIAVKYDFRNVMTIGIKTPVICDQIWENPPYGIFRENRNRNIF